MTKTELIRALKSIPALHKGRGYEWTFGRWTLSVGYDYLTIRNNDTNVIKAGMCLIDHVRWTSNRLKISWCDDLRAVADIWWDSMMISLHGEDTCGEDDDKWFPQDEEAKNDKG